MESCNIWPTLPKKRQNFTRLCASEGSGHCANNLSRGGGLANNHGTQQTSVTVHLTNKKGKVSSKGVFKGLGTKSRWFIDPSDRNQLYHTALLSKI